VHSRVSGRDQYALIIGNDALNESSATGWVMAAPIDTSGATPDLLVTMRLTHPVEGMIRLDNVTSVRKDRIGDLVGWVDPDRMDAVSVALRAALDL
jgi:mRNA-degrading endonuclease toxin of MazEF toxin-antitoxin module